MRFEIPLTRGKTAIVSENKYDIVKQFKWQAKSSRGKWYAVTNTSRKLGHKEIFMHHLIIGRKEGFQVDHIDGNGLNNTDENLRFSTPAQNQANRVTKSSIGFKGVSKIGKRYQASIGINYRLFYIGLYETPEIAAIHYDSVSRYISGEYARTNFPEIHEPIESKIMERLNKFMS